LAVILANIDDGFVVTWRRRPATAADQAREGELMAALLGPLGKAVVQDLLHPLPEFARDKRLVFALVGPAAIVEVAGVDPLAQDLAASSPRF